jgi:hypothetical protein
MVKVDGKMVVQPKQTLTSLDGWIPICEKSLPFELTASFLLVPNEPGVPRPIKLQEQHRPFFPAGREITEASGVSLALWAAGVDISAKTYAGECQTIVTFKKGAIDVTEVSIDGQTFSTVESDIAAKAKELEGKMVKVSYAPTQKGGMRLKSIEAVA